MILASDAQDCSDETADTNAFLAAPASPCRAEVPSLPMLVNASDTCDLAPELVLTTSAAFWNSATQEPLQYHKQNLSLSVMSFHTLLHS